MGLEPTRPFGQRILNPSRLPIPPSGLDSSTDVIGRWLRLSRFCQTFYDDLLEDEVPKQSMIERKLRENGDELKRAREQLRIAIEQLEHLQSDAEQARLRAMVSETPLAEQEHIETARHAEKMQRHHDELNERISGLETRQDELLDEMMGS